MSGAVLRRGSGQAVFVGQGRHDELYVEQNSWRGSGKPCLWTNEKSRVVFWRMRRSKRACTLLCSRRTGSRQRPLSFSGLCYSDAYLPIVTVSASRSEISTRVFPVVVKWPDQFANFYWWARLGVTQRPGQEQGSLWLPRFEGRPQTVAVNVWTATVRQHKLLVSEGSEGSH